MHSTSFDAMAERLDDLDFELLRMTDEQLDEYAYAAAARTDALDAVLDACDGRVPGNVVFFPEPSRSTPGPDQPLRPAA